MELFGLHLLWLKVDRIIVWLMTKRKIFDILYLFQHTIYSFFKTLFNNLNLKRIPDVKNFHSLSISSGARRIWIQERYGSLSTSLRRSKWQLLSTILLLNLSEYTDPLFDNRSCAGYFHRISILGISYGNWNFYHRLGFSQSFPDCCYVDPLLRWRKRSKKAGKGNDCRKQ